MEPVCLLTRGVHLWDAAQQRHADEVCRGSSSSVAQARASQGGLGQAQDRPRAAQRPLARRLKKQTPASCSRCCGPRRACTRARTESCTTPVCCSLRASEKGHASVPPGQTWTRPAFLAAQNGQTLERPQLGAAAACEVQGGRGQGQDRRRHNAKVRGSHVEAVKCSEESKATEYKCAY